MKLYVDNFCEITRFLQPHITEVFYDITKLPVDPTAVYVVGRVQMKENAETVRNLINIGANVIFSNPAEGSETFVNHLRAYGVEDLALSGKLKCIVGGSMPREYNCLRFEHFLTQPFRFDENHAAIQRTNEIFTKTNKPYKFLFLNGRTRPHRKYLLEYLKYNNLLDDALWTNLDTEAAHVRYMTYYIDHLDRMKDSMPVKYLPPEYEVDEYLTKVGTLPENDEKFAKYHLFSNTWGEIYLKPEPYIDTYFSLVTETVFEYPYSFRTEKIWKPITIGHPWIAVASQGYYRDMRNLGFKTFGHLVDESFDDIANEQDRIERISEVVTDLLKQDLKSFLAAAEEVCKYNQQHLVEVRKTVKQEFPTRLSNFLSKYFNE